MAFDDDIILLTKIFVSSIATVKSILDEFTSISSLANSTEKSRILFSRNTPNNATDDICSFLKIGHTTDLGKYLGFLNGQKRLFARHLQFIIDKVRSRLARWQSSMESFAGRKTIIQEVTSAIPSYYMQCLSLPKTVCENIDKANRVVLWGGSEHKRETSLVGWEKVICPEDLGGIGIRKTRLANEASFSKLNWRLYKKDEV
ncbi:hypothetical protein ACH5RR_040824 [Cinchona calisaya]|uniref:Reverse transcriptase n=1 Tax=Cinchona calisaya TaxID=153742 RepID=A0ABD2XX02_9GENT